MTLECPVTHAPNGYDCPMCALVRHGSNELVVPEDIIARTERALAFIAPTWWPRNEGHALVIPTVHAENLYDVSREALHAVTEVVQEVAIAMKRSYNCDGISTRQHNEPAGNQHVWHLHVHVYPRWEGDDLYGSLPLPGTIPPERRLPFARRLRRELGDREM